MVQREKRLMQIHPTAITEPDRWNQVVLELPHHDLLQSWQWGELKARYGWEAERIGDVSHLPPELRSDS